MVSITNISVVRNFFLIVDFCYVLYEVLIDYFTLLNSVSVMLVLKVCCMKVIATLEIFYLCICHKLHNTLSVIMKASVHKYSNQSKYRVILNE